MVRAFEQDDRGNVREIPPDCTPLDPGLMREKYDSNQTMNIWFRRRNLVIKDRPATNPFGSCELMPRINCGRESLVEDGR